MAPRHHLPASKLSSAAMLRCCRPRGRAGLRIVLEENANLDGAGSCQPTGTRATASTVQTQRSKQNALAAAMTSTLRSVWVGEEAKERERGCPATLTHSTTWAVVSEFVMRIWLRSMPCIHSSDGSCCDVQVAPLGYRRGSTVMRQRRCTANVASHTVVRPVVSDMEALPKLPPPLTREIGGPAPHCALDLRCVLS